ncbi:protein kinase [Myxococcota bacterium]|nr:protein kinase [Myxococcota bacterium]MBU1430567.1 protein kinase [Myxococcota bacterium]MBU1899835.1 protein kinase [Myxococcota bacterium]
MIETLSPSAAESRSVAPPPRELKRGERLGARFVIDERLRVDVMGVVYRAVDEHSGKALALTVLSPRLAEDEAVAEALRAAVERARGLTHRNIVVTYGMGKDVSGCVYVAREFVDGQTLTDALERKAKAGKRFTLKGAYNLIAHICNALQAARPVMHHGLLRPSSVLVNRTGRVKLGDFGLEALRPALVEGQRDLSVWDAPFFSPLSPPLDDLQALGHLLFALLTARPPLTSARRLPEEGVAGFPEALRDLFARAVDPAHPARFPDPNALTAELLHLVETVRSTIEPQRPPTAPPPVPAPSASAPPAPSAPPRPSMKPPAPPAPPSLRSGGGFVIPDLKAKPREIADDGTVPRWLVERDGIDYGPFTAKDVITQLFKKETTPETLLYDVETDRRLPLSEFTVFDEALVAWLHEKAEREKQAMEAAVAAASRRQTRIIISIILLLVVGGGGGVGGWFYYQSTLPTPREGRLHTLVAAFNAPLPNITPPEELPKTEAELREERERVLAHRRSAAAAAERAQIAKEEQLAAASELSMSGSGRRFNNDALNQAVAGRTGRLTKCLQDEARRDPNLKSVGVSFTVIPKGDLINVKMPGATPKGSRCARQALAGLKVPAFDGANVKINLPFTIR